MDIQNLPIITIGIGVLLTIGSLIFTGVIMFVVFRAVFGRIRENNRVLSTGEAGQATILRLWDTGTRLNDNPQVGLLMEVRPVGRPAYQVEKKAFVSLIKLSQVQPGSVVNVKIDPANPQNVALALL